METRDNKPERAKWSHIDPSASTVQAIITRSFYANNNCSRLTLWSLYIQDAASPEAVMAMTNSAF